MSPGEDPHGASRRRILLALDLDREDAAVFEAVADLAERMRADVTGLIVEEDDLVALAGHRGATAFSLVTRRWQRIETTQMEEAIRARSARVRRAIETAARRRNVDARLEVRRGRVIAEVLSLAETADLIVVGWASGAVSWQTGRPLRLGDVARAIAEGAARSVLLLREGGSLGGTVLVPYDGSPPADRAFEAACAVARRDGGRIDVGLVTDDEAQAEALAARVRARARERGLGIAIHRLGAPSLEAMCDLARLVGAGVLVLHPEFALLRGEAAERLLDSLRCSVLIAR